MLHKKVDVIIPVYNKASFLNNLFNNLKRLPSQFFNVILVDDGSKDDSYELMKKNIKDHNLNHFFLHKKNNGGVSSARNFGLDLSVSEYIWFFDPDDLIDERFFENIKDLEWLNEDVIVFNYSVSDLKTNTSYDQGFSDYGFFSKTEFMLKYDALLSSNKNMNYVWNKFYRKNFLMNIRFKEDLILGEDRYFNLDVFSHSGNVLILNFYLYKYFIYPGVTLSQNLNSFKIQNIYTVNHYNMKIHEFSRDICKAHIIDQVKIRTIFGENNLYSFYKDEHIKLNLNVLPYYTIQEFLLFILIFTRINVFCYKTFSYVKKVRRVLFLNQ